MIIEERDTAVAHWQAALLICLHDGESATGWVPLKDAQVEASKLAKARWSDEPIAFKTMSNQRSLLKQQGLIEQEQQGKHYQLRLTSEGREAADEVLENPDWGEVDSPTLMAASVASLEGIALPVRVGQGHKLARPEWAAVMKALEAGLVDVVVVARSTKTKVGYRA